MRFDTPISRIAETPDGSPSAERSADHLRDAPRSADATRAADQADADGHRAEPRVLTSEERLDAYWRARRAADEAYAAAAEDRNTATAQSDDPQYPDTTHPAPEVTDADSVETGLSQGAADAPASADEALRTRVAELEADKAARDKQLSAQDTKLAEQDQIIAELRSSKTEQDKRIVQLETDLGRIAASVSELRGRHDEPQPSAEIADRAGGGQADRAERAERQHGRRLPSDAVNNVVSLVAGGTITELAYHIRELPPEYAGIGASGLALGAGIVAVWRERRKAKDDADHRPES